MFQILIRSKELRKNEEKTKNALSRSINGDRIAHFELLDLHDEEQDIKKLPVFKIIWKS